MKDNADYGVIEKRKTPENGNVVSDEVIFFYSMAKAGKECFFRRIEVWDEEQQKVLVFLTNHLEFGATTIAAIYKDRWKVELFFKAIKQNLKIKTGYRKLFWTAVIPYPKNEHRRGLEYA
jgi:IS4 transposase